MTFPGTKEAWGSYSETTDANLIAEQEIRAAVDPYANMKRVIAVIEMCSTGSISRRCWPRYLRWNAENLRLVRGWWKVSTSPRLQILRIPPQIAQKSQHSMLLNSYSKLHNACSCLHIGA
ncbi:hypothetical protein POM88_043472 [Heracleum sosnowskyi]|uniref:Uncharacterized protein n=1 Tax=Heracleum sosnowskyi TaxID=360622 RepID=A0AAD8M4G4_9APIA|nr:hypothetical protein POM88_043472 [Heracleum sosnowskyi]